MSRALPILRPALHAARISRRTRLVWGAFGAAMALACGVLVLGDAEGPRPVTAMSVIGPDAASEGIVPREAPLNRERWNAIVIHHSATPAGDAGSIARLHASAGLDGLGYHFIVGNGQGLPDGYVEAGARWHRQQPGAHVAASPGQSGGVERVASKAVSADDLNRHAIAICLVGNGDRRPFTDRQMHELGSLVRRIQSALGIPADRIYLHSDVAGTTSPGRFFQVSSFENSILRDGNP
ncbi:MAG: N-acetylmuramoyl-L-alanine amidase [Planctomycetes bacterium]|nr:N-acetylmuramoyl-L-alanine amidase [Planctomycetota bacterium]